MKILLTNSRKDGKISHRLAGVVSAQRLNGSTAQRQDGKIKIKTDRNYSSDGRKKSYFNTKLFKSISLFIMTISLSACGTITGLPSHGGGKRFAIEQELIQALLEKR